jgi:hypothetical protein
VGVPASRFLSHDFGLLDKKHFNFMNFSVDIGVSAVSGSFAQGQILILFVLYLSNFLCNEYDIILVDFLFFWIFQNGFFLLLFHVSPNRYCVTLHLHVINPGLPTIKYLGFAYNEELLHHTVQ